MNILVVGLGSIAKKHINSLREHLGHINLYALRSSAEPRSEPGIVNIHSLSEAISVKFDFAIISNPTSEHIVTIRLLLDLACPLFIEKPLADSLDVADILAEVKERGIFTYVACNLRFLHCLQFVNEELKSGKRTLNEVNIYCGSFLPGWRPGNFRDYYSAKAELGGGVHLDLIHELDYAYWLFGQPTEVKRILTNKSSLNLEVYDYANYALLYDGFSVSVILNYYRQDAKRTFEIVFDDETWTVDLIQNQVSSGGRTIFESPQIINDTYSDQIKYFIETIKTGRNSFNSIEDSYNVLSICLS